MTADLILSSGSDHLKPAGVHLQNPSVAGDDLHALGGRFDDRSQLLFALAQRLFSQFRIVNVGGGAKPADHFAVAILHGDGPPHEPAEIACPAVFEPALDLVRLASTY